MDDTYYMQMALDLARQGRGHTSPNPMVGAVVVKNDTVAGKGFHPAAGEPHAEVFALDNAGEASRGATLYVTLEPCNHFGRTPPCTRKILEAGIDRVVVAMDDPNPRVTGGGNDYLRSHGVSVTTGVCEAQARKLNESFVKYILTKRPFVTIKCASTLDGRLATRTGDAKWVTGPEARGFVHQLRHDSDGIMVGIGTVKMDDPRLTTRLADGKGVDPIRIILDTHLNIPEDAKVLRTQSDSGTVVAVGDSVPEDKRNRLESRGIQVLRSPLKDGRIDLAQLMVRLGEMEITSILLEGGGRVIAAALAAGIADKICFFYAPKILGGDDGVPICSGTGPALMKEAIPVKDMAVHRFGEDVMVEGYL